MFGQRRQSLLSKADLLGPHVGPQAIKTVEVIEKALNELNRPPVSDEQRALLIGEVLALYLHLLDRLAFGQLGPKGRALFCDRLYDRTEASLISGEATGRLEYLGAARLRAIYNDRQVEYAHCTEIFPEGDTPHGGTLIWEFSEVAVHAIGDDDRADIIPIWIAVGSMIIPFLEVAEEVLRS